MSMAGPGSSSITVGHSFLKRVVGFAINPWGIRSRRKCESNDAPATMTNFWGSFEIVLMVSVVIKHDTAMCVVAVMKLSAIGVNPGTRKYSSGADLCGVYPISRGETCQDREHSIHFRLLFLFSGCFSRIKSVP